MRYIMLYLLLILGISVQFAYGQSGCTFAIKKGDTLIWNHVDPIGNAVSEGELIITGTSGSVYTLTQTVKGKPDVLLSGQITAVATNRWQFKDVFNNNSWELECEESESGVYFRSVMSSEGTIFWIAPSKRD